MGVGEDPPPCQHCIIAREALQKYHGSDVDFDELFAKAEGK